MRWLPVWALAGLVLLAGAASASSGSRPTGRIVFAMNHFCLVQGPNGGGKVPVDCGRGEVAVVNADGSHLRVLTRDKVTETSPVWSPNGEQIAFLRPKAHTSDQIWVMNANGTHQRALTRFRNAPQLFGGDELPNLSWSPDGQQIVFAAFPTNQGGREQLFLLNVRTRGVKRLTHLSTGATNPIWSPNGRWIAFVGGVAPNRIYLLSPRTHRVHALTTKKGASVTGLGIAWSPDSRRLAFNTGGRVVSFDVSGRSFRTLARFGEEPSWSPDGQWVVFVYGDYVKEVRANGMGMRRILHVNSQKGWNFEPDWGR
jgi:Tol biopolymer transport system component